MSLPSIAHLFEGVAAKYLSEVDANPKKSNQHEIGGLVRVGFKNYLGEPQGRDVFQFPAKMMYLEDDSEASEIIEDRVSWYNARHGKPNRSAEFRLYYRSNSVTERFQAGDFCLIAKSLSGELLILFTPMGSTHESQLRMLFGLPNVVGQFTSGTLSRQQLSLPMLYLLEALGYQFEFSDETSVLEQLISQFGGENFPSTADFSQFARQFSAADLSSGADVCLLAWMETEEKLFRVYEKHLVSQKLQQGFGAQNDQVENFIRYSLSVQNRRKARAGHAFEKHLTELFHHYQLPFEQGSAKRTTENNKKPDFLFPNFDAYHDLDFPQANLRLLGAKTSCKDRWRQVLSEGDRVTTKHLITLEPAISENQTEEMRSHHLQLIVPRSLQETYSTNQQSWLMDLEGFIQEVRLLQQ